MLPWPLFGASLWSSDLAFALPLVVAVSVVYAGTRHERMDVIVKHSIRLTLMILFFMVLIFGVLWYLSWLVTG